MPSAPTNPEVGSYRLWFGMLGGAIAWSIHILAITATAEWGCLGGLDRWRILGFSSVASMIAGWTIAMLFVAAVATFVAYGNFHRLHIDAVREPVGSGKTSHFLAQVGMLTSGTFVFVILVQSLPVLFYLAGC